MNFVALALLEACGGNDENAFWILAGMCENLELEVNAVQRLVRVRCCEQSTAASNRFRDGRTLQFFLKRQVATVTLQAGLR